MFSSPFFFVLFIYFGKENKNKNNEWTKRERVGGTVGLWERGGGGGGGGEGGGGGGAQL